SPSGSSEYDSTRSRSRREKSRNQSMWQAEIDATNSSSGSAVSWSPPSSGADEAARRCAARWTVCARRSSRSASQTTVARCSVSLKLTRSLGGRLRGLDRMRQHLSPRRLLALRHPEHLPGLGDRGRAAADVLGHLAGLGDQVAVRPRHLAIRQVQVVLETG